MAKKELSWYFSVLTAIKVAFPEKGSVFTASQLYQFEDVFKIYYPDNNFITDKIRQQVQDLAKNGHLLMNGSHNYGKGVYQNPGTPIDYRKKTISNNEIIILIKELEKLKNNLTVIQQKGTSGSSIVRDPKVVKEIKTLYNGTCQMCSTTVVTVRGNYSECAHIVPISLKGADNLTNVLCLCPNCHKYLDGFGIIINPSLEIKYTCGKNKNTIYNKLYVDSNHELDISNFSAHEMLYKEIIKYK